MDELTRERFGDFVPWYETHRKPSPIGGQIVVPVSTEEQQRRRRQELVEALDGWTKR